MKCMCNEGIQVKSDRVLVPLVHQQPYGTSHLWSTFSYLSAQKMAKRKVDFENRSFQGRWEAEYMFADMKAKAVCLVCGDGVAVMKPL